MDKYIYPTLYNECNYLSMLVLKLIHLSKRGQWSLAINDSGNDLSAEVAKSLPEPMLTKYRLEHCVQTSVIVELKNPEVTFMKMQMEMSSAKWRPFFRLPYVMSITDVITVLAIVYSIIHVLAVSKCYMFF